MAKKKEVVVVKVEQVEQPEVVEAPEILERRKVRDAHTLATKK